MKLLLTSGGVTNQSIHDSLVTMLGKPIEQCSALAIPTASYGHTMCTPENAWKFLTGNTPGPLCNLGWKSLGVLELSVLESLGEARWRPWVEEVDAILVDGGDASFLAYWMQRSGFSTLIPSLNDTTWVGVSAGSMVLTPRVGKKFVTWTPPGRQDPAGDDALGLVNFGIFPHLEVFATNTLGAAERWASELVCPAFAIDDQSAISVIDGVVEVISEGTWKHFPGTT